jgi:hypothetical protein
MTFNEGDHVIFKRKKIVGSHRQSHILADGAGQARRRQENLCKLLE